MSHNTQQIKLQPRALDWLDWLEAIDWRIAHGPDMPGAERRNYGEVVLEQRMRDTLLPKLISGELRVKDAERFLKERGL